MIARRALVATAVLAAALTLPAAGAAAAGPPRGRPIDTAGGVPRGDGRRWLAWVARGRRLQTLDVRTGERGSFGLPDGCELSAVGGGQALFACAPPVNTGETTVPLLLDLDRATLHYPAGVGTLIGREDDLTGVSFEAVGRYVISGVSGGGLKGGHPSVAYDWRSGATLPPPRAGWIRDRDRRSGVRALCAPLRDFGGRASYAPPWGAFTHSAHLTVGHCGRARTRTIRCHDYCGEATVGAGLLTWSDSGSARAMDLRTGRRWSFGSGAFLAQAGRTVAVSGRTPRSSRLLRLPG
jgi:hypothetical protein